VGLGLKNHFGFFILVLPIAKSKGIQKKGKNIMTVLPLGYIRFRVYDKRKSLLSFFW